MPAFLQAGATNVLGFLNYQTLNPKPFKPSPVQPNPETCWEELPASSFATKKYCERTACRATARVVIDTYPGAAVAGLGFRVGFWVSWVLLRFGEPFRFQIPKTWIVRLGAIWGDSLRQVTVKKFRAESCGSTLLELMWNPKRHAFKLLYLQRGSM